MTKTKAINKIDFAIHDILKNLNYHDGTEVLTLLVSSLDKMGIKPNYDIELVKVNEALKEFMKGNKQ